MDSYYGMVVFDRVVNENLKRCHRNAMVACAAQWTVHRHSYHMMMVHLMRHMLDEYDPQALRRNRW